MKKGKILALALAAGITFMGAGYAAWTDSVQINTTVATGNLDVDFLDTKDGDNKKFEVGEIGNLDKDDSNDKNKCMLTIDNLYPGIELTSKVVTLIGKGSVTAVLDNMNTNINLYRIPRLLDENTDINIEEYKITSDSMINYKIYIKRESEESWKYVETKVNSGKIQISNYNEIKDILTIKKDDKVNLQLGVELKADANDSYEENRIILEFIPEFMQENMTQEIPADNDGNNQ